jgi:hypothetical protein
MLCHYPVTSHHRRGISLRWSGGFAFRIEA